MIETWIEPAIEKRVQEVIGLCEEQTFQLNEEFNEILKKLKEVLPNNSRALILKLEDALIQNSINYADKCYRFGFEDALNLIYTSKR
ncbi:hypothetical protein ACFQ5D_03065 [Paenibacillus farraposensis]|uniref:Uncharacterized protein n=1 Tax=Paenibacillus farraposensis TaxID=2807095 RepID=A0ABW4D9J2_9BACL|nr:hypothetical protein [Paenibacillus farraposensis]MCC3381871.1 hypothetical protein [Paenibacillus farraposensis]